MTDSKLTDLATPTGGPAVGDKVYLVDVSDTTDSPQGSSRETTIGELPRPTGKTLWVDSVNGNDGTGKRGDAAYPFLTPTVAQAAALSGDVIHVRPGSYSVTAALGKAGVNWRLEAGVTIDRSDAGAGALFDDGGVAMDFAVTGAGVLTRTVGAGVQGYVVNVSHANSKISVKARRLAASSDAASLGAFVVACQAGVLSVHADTIETTTGVGLESCVWWTNGSLHVQADRIQNIAGGTWTLYMSCNATPTGEANITANEIVGPTPMSLQGLNTVQAVWINAKTVRSIDTTAQAIHLIGSGRYYLDCEKIFGKLRATSVGGGSSNTYIRAQKWSAVVNGGLLLDVASGTHNIKVDLQEADAAGFTGNMFAFVGAGNTTTIDGMQYVGNSGSNGLSITSGTVRLINCLLDTSANNATNPVTKSGGTLVLWGASLVAEGTRDAVTAGSAQTVLVWDMLTTNRPLNANIAITGGPVVRTDSAAFSTTGATVRMDLVGLVLGGWVSAAGAYDETTSTAGVYAGIVAGNPRILFCNGNNAQNFQIDNNGGSFRWYLPGVVKMSLDSSGFVRAFGGFHVGNTDTVLSRPTAKVLGLGDGGSNGIPVSSIPVTPSQITGDQNNYAPSVAWYYRLTSDAARTLTGLSIGQVDGQACEFWNVGTQNIVLAHESASSTAANRFTCTTAANITLTPGQMAFLRWFSADQSGTGRWRVTKGN